MLDSRRATTLATRLVAAGVLMTVMGCESTDRLSREQVASDLELSRRTALVKAVERVAPTVVGVWAVSRQTVVSNNPGAEFLERFFQVPRLRSQSIPQMGSGIVLDSRGFFLTNDHLVTGTDNIWVRLDDGRTFEAVVTGRDPNYDLAVIQLKEQGNVVFDTSPLGDSDDLMVGEWVMAVGNPYGLYIGDAKPSVTAGVVSALHRDIKLSEGSAIYKDMIQTDAAINPGNSGGALINSRGQLVGINTAIFSQSGGYQGIGFAVPSNLARRVMEDLIEFGEVRRGTLGYFEVIPITNELAREIGLRQGQSGVVVARIDGRSGAYRAGLRPADAIVRFDGTLVEDASQLQRLIADAPIGSTVALEVLRGDRQLEIDVPIVQASRRR
jgi:S1-C subfamily serine protease